MRALRHPIPSRRREGGLSMIEVMIALAILAGGMLAMLAMQIAAMRQGRVGRDYTEASTFARVQMETLQRTAFAALVPNGLWVNAVRNGAQTGGGGGGAQAAQVYNLSWRVNPTPDANVVAFDVRVTWAEPNSPPGATLKRFAISSGTHNDP